MAHTPARSSWKNTGARVTCSMVTDWGIWVTPMGSPSRVVMVMPMTTAPLTRKAINMAVRASPTRVSRPWVFHTRCPSTSMDNCRAGTAPLMEMSPTFSRPIKAINRPIPAEMACFMKSGMEWISFPRRGDTAMAKKSTPLMSTMARPSCQV